MLIISRQHRGQAPYFIYISLFILCFLSLFLLIAQRSAHASSPTLINVTTTIDEDADPGTGCSLYEATVAANTSAAYGGCTAGTIGNNIIVLPAGNYMRDASSESHKMLSLADTSILGAGKGVTKIEGYFYTLTGNQEASITNADLTSILGSTTTDASVNFYINGSNKTLDSLNIYNDRAGAGSVGFRFASGGQTVSAIHITNTDAGSNSGSSDISCGGTCSSISFDHFKLTTMYSSTISLSDVGAVSLAHTSLTAMYQATVSVGINSSVFQLQLTAPSGQTIINTGVGSTIDGVDAESPTSPSYVTGSAISVKNVIQHSSIAGFTITTPLVDTYQTNAPNITFNNPYVGSIIKNVTITGTPQILSFSNKAAILENISVTDTGITQQIGFQNTYDNASLQNINIMQTNTNSYPALIFNVTGANIIANNIVLSSNEEIYAVSFNGLNPTVTNSLFHNASLRFSSPGNITFNNVSVDGGTDTALYVDGTVGIVSIANSDFTNSVGGILIHPSNETTSSVIINNVSVEGINSTTNFGALAITNVGYVTVNALTIANSIQTGLGSLQIEGGIHHDISNVTISDSAGGMAFSSDTNFATSVDVRNSTILNNTAFVTNTLNDGLALQGQSTSFPVNVSLSNSIIAGNADFTKCDIRTYATLLANSNFASNSSCGIGFTQISNLTSFMDETLQTNSSAGSPIGYSGRAGFLKTLALKPTSSAIGAGNPSLCSQTDARGMLRTFGLGCDVGAFQYTLVAVPVPTTIEKNGNNTQPKEAIRSVELTITADTPNDVTTDDSVSPVIVTDNTSKVSAESHNLSKNNRTSTHFVRIFISIFSIIVVASGIFLLLKKRKQKKSSTH